MCRERGGGEAPGASMSRLNIYTYIVVLGCPPGLRGPGREGYAATWGSSEAGVKAPGVHAYGAAGPGWGSEDPVTRCWESASRGGQTSARKLLPFFLLSVFLPGDI